MMYIVSEDDEDTWHVGEDNPIDSEMVIYVTEVQADCDELEYLYQHFPNLPQAKRQVVHFYGDVARFIVGNLI